MGKRKLKPWVKETASALVICSVIFIFLFLLHTIARDEENHIKIVSAKCAEQGKGIEPYYENDGEKFYRCVK